MFFAQQNLYQIPQDDRIGMRHSCSNQGYQHHYRAQ